MNLLRVHAPGMRTVHLAYELADGKPGNRSLCFAAPYEAAWFVTSKGVTCAECERLERENAARLASAEEPRVKRSIPQGTGEPRPSGASRGKRKAKRS